MGKVFFIIILLLSFVTQISYADKGVIPFEENVKIFEPIQRAMIAWNGKEEILLLSTDLHASKATKVLEVLPLRSEPAVKKGDVETFKKTVDLINKKLAAQRKLSFRAQSTNVKGAGIPDINTQPAGEVTFHEKIGAHDVNTTHVLNTDGFVEWVKKYLKTAGVENPMIPDNMKTIVNTYIKEGFSWFVFDVVSLDESPKTNEAIQYKFATQVLFYPLRISGTGEGNTSIQLLILTPKLLSDFQGIPVFQIKLLHNPVTIDASELQNLNNDMNDLLGRQNDMRLRIWQLEGKLSEFDKDLVAAEVRGK